jgi:hypothetical protein
VNLADLALFCQEGNWLWQACWADVYDCVDSAHLLDWDGDGLINMVEFSLFSTYWQTSLPGDPAWQYCNLDNTGDSEDIIDMADLSVFMQDWLWVACWRELKTVNHPLDHDGDGAVDLTELSLFASLWLSYDPQDPAWQFFNRDTSGTSQWNIDMKDLAWLSRYWTGSGIQPSGELTVEELGEQIVQLEESIAFFENLWLFDPEIRQQIDPEDWQAFMEALNYDLWEKTRFLYELRSGMGMLEQVLHLQETIAFFEDIWLTDPDIQQQISPEDWQAFMDTLYQQLDELTELLTPDELMILDMINGGGGGQMMMSVGAETMRLTETAVSVENSITRLQDSIAFLEQIWLEDLHIQQEINAEDWKEFMDKVYQSLYDLQTGTVQSE